MMGDFHIASQSIFDLSPRSHYSLESIINSVLNMNTPNQQMKGDSCREPDFKHFGLNPLNPMS